MAFKDTYRLEKVYYENIWTLLKLLKNVDKNNVDMGTVKELLDNAIADNESIIIIYKNLGELYAELQNQHMELGKELEKLRESLEEFKDEINDKIDENHNYLMGLIKDLEQRVDALEHAVDSLEERMDQAETDIDNLETRMDTAEGDIDNLETAVDGLEDNLTALDGRVTTNEGDIDDLEQNKQDKLTAGSGIAIDPDTHEITNTAQGKVYRASEYIYIENPTSDTPNILLHQYLFPRGGGSGESIITSSFYPGGSFDPSTEVYNLNKSFATIYTQKLASKTIKGLSNLFLSWVLRASNFFSDYDFTNYGNIGKFSAKMFVNDYVDVSGGGYQKYIRLGYLINVEGYIGSDSNSSRIFTTNPLQPSQRSGVNVVTPGCNLEENYSVTHQLTKGIAIDIEKTESTNSDILYLYERLSTKSSIYVGEGV